MRLLLNQSYVGEIRRVRVILRGFIAQLGEARLDAGDVATQDAQAGRFFELCACLLQAQIENLLPQIAPIGQQFLERLFLNLFTLRLFH